ncbi:MAG TPA: hypothetical protein VNX29_16115 [Kaistia sp.]|nr:hypothetical protein [Kaistia sp.]
MRRHDPRSGPIPGGILNRIAMRPSTDCEGVATIQFGGLDGIEVKFVGTIRDFAKLGQDITAEALRLAAYQTGSAPANDDYVRRRKP